MIEKLTIWLAWKLPKQLAYWATIRVMTKNMENGPSQEMMQILENWQKGEGDDNGQAI